MWFKLPAGIAFGGNIELGIAEPDIDIKSPVDLIVPDLCSRLRVRRESFKFVSDASFSRGAHKI